MEFLKSFRSEFRFVASIVEERLIISIERVAITCLVEITEELIANSRYIKSFDANGILESKITNVSIFDIIAEIKPKELQASQAVIKRVI
jgi:hypothetical protein